MAKQNNFHKIFLFHFQINKSHVTVNHYDYFLNVNVTMTIVLMYKLQSIIMTTCHIATEGVGYQKYNINIKILLHKEPWINNNFNNVYDLPGITIELYGLQLKTMYLC